MKKREVSSLRAQLNSPQNQLNPWGVIQSIVATFGATFPTFEVAKLLYQ